MAGGEGDKAVERGVVDKEFAVLLESVGFTGGGAWGEADRSDSGGARAGPGPLPDRPTGGSGPGA